jgi:hypothetical protein
MQVNEQKVYELQLELLNYFETEMNELLND